MPDDNRAYDSNFCFDIRRVANADYLLTYLLNYNRGLDNIISWKKSNWPA